jgi:hypothetical protein
MSAERMQALDEMVTALLREESPISTDVEPKVVSTHVESKPATSVDQMEPTLAAPVDETSSDKPPLKAAVVEPPGDKGNAMPEQPNSVLTGLNLDTAIRLRWALRDIKAKRTKMSPVSPDDLAALIELGLVEVRDGVPILTNDGDRALD